MRSPRRRDPELGAATLEHLAVSVFAVVLTASVVTAVPAVAGAVSDAASFLVCRVVSTVTGQGCQAPAGEDGEAAPPGPPPDDGRADGGGDGGDLQDQANQDQDDPDRRQGLPARPEPLRADPRQRPLEPSDPPPVGTDPRQVAAWWAALTPAQRDAIIHADPDRIGTLDGLPASVKHEANMIVLNRELDRTEREIARLQREIGELGDEDQRDRVQRQLDDANRYHDMLAAVQEQVHAAPNRTLLLLDTTGEGRAAVGIGPVDDAEHVAVLVPGLNTRVTSGLSGLVSNAQRLHTTANRLTGEVAGDAEVATIAWLGYETPTLSTVAFPDHAETGAVHLDSTLEGLQAARDAAPLSPGGDVGEPLHLTLIGHSYGSLTTGLTLQEATPVDDAIFLGSPGVGAGHVSELQVPDGHVFVGEARRDAVADFNHFGIDPSSDRFGAREFGTRETVDPRTSQPLRESTGHSEYFHMGSSSIQSQAYVMLGREDLTIPGESNGVGDFLSRGRQATRDAVDGIGGILDGIWNGIDKVNPL